LSTSILQQQNLASWVALLDDTSLKMQLQFKWLHKCVFNCWHNLISGKLIPPEFVV